MKIVYKKGMYQGRIKRTLDVILSLSALVILFPFLLVVSLFIRVKIGSPLFFCQERPGKNGEVFTMYKFRSMTNERDAKGNFLPDSERLHFFGKCLRASSIDELPELVNILKGDMSIVGPRPLLVQYLPLYTDEQKIRHFVRPGLTGLAQVNGRNTLSWEEKFLLDAQYVGNISFSQDMRIILLTMKKVFQKDTIHSDNHCTMEEFRGSKAGD
ncbi:MAG: sugar transferase [Carnobacterium maltaromaticum]|uniref:sugar transferase n=1 Tax=Carnobacterium maltaromaticum TaxID=2751 RepID=UPI0019FE05AF|nr:putative phosphotransferase involved in extracellular matrix synthesis [Carnobacterium maltaromaticum]